MAGINIESGPVLLYDGSCAFCAASVQFILARDRRETLRFAPLDGPFGRAVLTRHAGLGAVDSVVWVEPAREGQAERTFTRSDAAIRAAMYLGGVWQLVGVARIVPRRLRDCIYDIVARHRHHLGPGGQRCLVPTAEQHVRFLM